jgi:hypothetical protein
MSTADQARSSNRAPQAWYIAVQGVAAVVQFAIALLMLAGYRRSGVWGAF